MSVSCSYVPIQCKLSGSMKDSMCNHSLHFVLFVYMYKNCTYCSSCVPNFSVVLWCNVYISRGAATRPCLRHVACGLLQHHSCRIAKMHYWQATTFTECCSMSRTVTRTFDDYLSLLLHDELHWLDIPERVHYKLGVKANTHYPCSVFTAREHGRHIWHRCSRAPVHTNRVHGPLTRETKKHLCSRAVFVAHEHGTVHWCLHDKAPK